MRKSTPERRGDGKLTARLSGLFPPITNRQRSAVTITSLLLLSLVTGLYALKLADSGYGDVMYDHYFVSAGLIALNLIPPFLLIFAIYFATGRAWLGFGIGAGFILLLASINYYKLQLRGDPFMVVDFTYAVEAGRMLSHYNIDFKTPFTNAVTFVILGTVWTAVGCRYRFRGARRRIIASLATAATLFGLSSTVYMNNAVFAANTGSLENKFPTVNEAFVARGFVYPFIYSFKGAFPPSPDGYSAAAAKRILAQHPTEPIPAEERINVISVMLEAFCDMSEYLGDAVSPKVYDKWHALQKESLYGNLVVNTFGGGTINTERLFLTGNTHLTDIRGATESYVYYFRDNGYYAEGLHAGTSEYYNRVTVNRDLGFNNYYFIDNFPETSRTDWFFGQYLDWNRTDEFFFPKLAELYAKRDKSVPYFNHSLSFQNHGGYDWPTTEPYLLSREGFEEGTFDSINNYLIGVEDTVDRIGAFIDTLRNDPEPVILLLYGDHKPAFGLHFSFSDLDDDDDEGGTPVMYSTPYIIWANDAARAVLTQNDGVSPDSFVGYGGDFSPTFLMTRLFDLTGWQGDSYMQMTRAAMAETPVVNQAVESTEALAELRIVEYWRRKNFLRTKSID